MTLPIVIRIMESIQRRLMEMDVIREKKKLCLLEYQQV